MTAPSATLFASLRRLRGAWLLVAAALVIKLLSGTACLLDGARVAATDVVQVMQAQAADEGDPGCLLDERGGCHCACAHAAALPSHIATLAAYLPAPARHAHVPVEPSPQVPGSPLRPPIA
ncbi:hypothetical protein KPL74_18375 [Bacillus sp. NP157]|nr:hypothetical protein KPL74_18375 [Bacillus sp. NP157]